MAGKIKVMLGNLAEPLKVSSVNSGTKLGDFLEKKGVEFNSSIRVNGKVARKGQTLRNNDIITTIDDVSGGK